MYIPVLTSTIFLKYEEKILELEIVLARTYFWHCALDKMISQMTTNMKV